MKTLVQEEMEYASGDELPPVPSNPVKKVLLVGVSLLAIVLGVIAGGGKAHETILLLGIQLDFLVFAVCLGCIVFSHKMGWNARNIALTALCIEIGLQLYYGTDLLHHLTAHGGHEARMLTNIFGLLLGFGVMAKLFEHSRLGDWLPHILPDDWKGGAMLLGFVFVGSMFLDNIAAAMIGGVIAKEVFRHKVSIGYLAAIVAVSNAGGAPSVVGDTTTTMMWIGGVPWYKPMPAIIGAIGAFLVIAYFGAKQQDAVQRIDKDPPEGFTLKNVGWTRVGTVFLCLVGAVSTNVLLDFPVLGVWAALVLGVIIVGRKQIPWGETSHILPEAVFITSLVALAGLMPVKALPDPSMELAFGLGWLSAVFDNIPLTAIAIKQNGYCWAMLAYAVGFGGSMTWFGSSAGVAICAEFKEGKNLFAWIKQGWFVPIGYVAGFALMAATYGWNPMTIPRDIEPVHAPRPLTASSGDEASATSATQH